MPFKAIVNPSTFYLLYPDINAAILLEALFITAIAGYAGLTAGIYCLEGLNSAIGHEEGAMFTNPTVDISIAMKALSVIIVGGLIAGFIPARRAVAIHPVEALRTE